MRCKMVFGFMSLGGILYLSTLPLGNAQPGQCSLVDGSFCRGYNTSQDGSGPRPWCCNSSDLICTGNDYASDQYDPYDPTYNNSGTCNICTHIIGDDCSITSGTPCCAGLYCDLSYECKTCRTPGDYCYSTTANTPGSCCPWGQDGNNAAIQYACIESYCIACSGQNAACDSSSTHCCDGLTCDPYSSTCQYCSLPQYDTNVSSCDWYSAYQQNIKTKECCGNLTCYPVDDTDTIYACLDCVDDHEVCDPSIADICCGDEFNCATAYGESDYYCQECFLENATCSIFGVTCCDQMSCYPDSKDTWRCTQCSAEWEECNLDLQPCCGTMECFLYSSTQAPLCMNCTEGGEPCDDTVPDCCEGFDCLAGYCQPCIDMGVACNPNFTTACCDNGTCYYNSTADGLTCQNCTDEHETCDPSGSACCGNFSCSYNSTSDTYSCQNCIPEYVSCDVDDDVLVCCGNLTCYYNSTVDNTTCQDCLDIGVTCTVGQNVPECCGELYCTNSTSNSTVLNCADCIQTGINCTTDQTCCSGQSCGADGICPASLNGALSLFSTNISLKQLVGFAVVMMAAGIL